MATHLRGQQSDKPQVIKRIPLERLVIVVVILLLVLVGSIIGVLHSQENRATIPIIVSVVFAVLGIVFVLLQLYNPGTSSADTGRPFTPPKSPRFPSSRDRFSKSPKSPPPNKPISRSMHELPSTNSKTILERRVIVEDLYTSLTRQGVTAIILKGMAGIGKSTLAALVSKYAEERRIAGNGPFITETLWIEISANDTMVDLAKTLFEAFNKPLLNFERLTPNQLGEALFDVLNTPKMARLVVLDQFDNLLDVQTGQISTNQSDVSDWIDMLNRQQSTSRLLFTSRFWPQGTFHSPTTYLQEYHVKNLENDEGVELLRRLKIEGTEDELRIAVEHCEGHPLALRLLATFLDDYHLSLTAFVKDPIFTKLWLEDVAQDTLDHLFMKQLSQMQRELLTAFSIYREAMPLSAAVALLDSNAELSKTETQSAFDLLLAQNLISEVGKSRDDLNKSAYRLHTIIASYIQKNHTSKDQVSQPALALRVAHARAARFYLEKISSSCPPREQRQSISDIYPLIEALWHLCQAWQYQEAYDLAEREYIFSDLRQWQENSILLGLYQMLLPLDKWHPVSSQMVSIYNNLGKVHSELGHKKEAQKYFEQALSIVRDAKERGRILIDLGSVYSILGNKEEAKRYLEQAIHIVKEIGDREGEINALNNLGLIHDDLGQKERAMEVLDRALSLCRETEDRFLEGRTLNNLGLVYIDVGQKEDARKYYEQALRISREIGDRGGEATTLRNLGQVYDELGQKTEGLKYLDQALSISREVGDRWEEGRALNYFGRIYMDLGQYEEALKYYERALRILEEVGDRWEESRILNNLGYLYSELGYKAEAKKYFDWALGISREVKDRRGEGRIITYSHRLHENHERKREHLERALDISREVKDRRNEGLTLHNLGKLYYEQGLKKEAREHYIKALHIHRELGDSRRVGLTLHHIGELYFEQRHYEAALASLLLAKMILEEVQSPDHEKVQKLMDTLHREVGKQQFDELLEQVEPRIHQIVEEALSNGH